MLLSGRLGKQIENLDRKNSSVRNFFRMMLSEWGVCLTPQGREWMQTELNGGSTPREYEEKDIQKNILDFDFRSIPSSAFSGIQFPEKDRSVLVVQVLKVTDISRPVGPEDETESEEGAEEISHRRTVKRFSGGRRFLRLNLSSLAGEIKFEALEVFRNDSISENLVPGTKLLLRGPINLVAGFALLESQNSVKVLGGGVKRLAESWQLNRDVKARRGDITSGDQSSALAGPPRFISFLDYLKLKPTKSLAEKPKPPTQDTTKQEIEQERRSLENATVTDKLKDLKSAKVARDAFAMKGKGNNIPRRPRSRRENDELIDMYKPPSHQAPQLASFIRLDKCATLHDAQMLSDAVNQSKAEDFRPPSSGRGGKGSSRSRESHKGMKGGSRVKGKARM